MFNRYGVLHGEDGKVLEVDGCTMIQMYLMSEHFMLCILPPFKELLRKLDRKCKMFPETSSRYNIPGSYDPCSVDLMTTIQREIAGGPQVSYCAWEGGVS